MVAFPVKRIKTIEQLKVAAILGVSISLLVVFLFIGFGLIQKNNTQDSAIAPYSFTPWAAIGGCGAGGGAKGGAAIEWMGQGVSGGYVDIELMPSFTSTPKMPGGSIVESQSVAIPFTVYSHLSNYTIGLILPFQSITSSMAPGAISTTGLGDITLSISKPLGVENQYTLTSSFALPTGRYDIFHDADNAPLVASAGQIGTGVLSATLSLNRTKDKEWGLYLLGIEYSAGLWRRKTTEYTYDLLSNHHTSVKRGWEWARNGGFTYENEIHVVSSDNLGLKAIGVIKSNHIHHSFHAKFNMPMQYTNSVSLLYYDSKTSREIGSLDADSAISFYRNDTDDPLKKEAILIQEDIDTADGSKTFWFMHEQDPAKFKTWATLTLGYGMEIFNPTAPIFWAFSVPIEFDGENKIGRKTQFGVNGFSIQAGIKFVAF
jgi:hypothetical protein